MSVIIDGTSGITPVSVSENLTFNGAAARIIGDFTNSTIANRTMFQTGTTNGQTAVGVLPNGTSTQSQFLAFNGTDVANSAYAQLLVSATEMRLNSGVLGTGSDLPMTFYTGSAERMRIDTSGNVGVGTSSPTYKLDVVGGNFRVAQTSGMPTAVIQSNQASGYAPSQFQLYRTGASNTATPDNSSIGEIRFDGLNAGGSYDNMAMIQVVCGTNASGGAPSYMTFATASSGSNATERMRLDSSGNLGLGVTPSAWNALYRAFEIGKVGSGLYINTSNGNVNVNAGFYNDGTGAVYAANSPAAYYNIAASGGTHTWYNAPSGTAGDPVTFTQAMTLDASGRLGIGTTSPAARLMVDAAEGENTRFRNSSNGGHWSIRLQGDGASANNFHIDNDSLPDTFTIKSSGNVGVGTGSPAVKLQVVGTSGSAQFRAGTASNGYFDVTAYDASPVYCLVDGSSHTAGVFGTRSNTPAVFFTNNSEAMRIETSGAVGIGTSAPVAGYSLTTQDAVWINDQATDMTPDSIWSGQVTVKASGYNGGLALDGTGLWVGHNSASRAILFATAYTEKMRIDAAGVVYSTQPAPFNSNAAVTLTVANLQAGILTSTPAAAIAWTLPTGTVMDATLGSLPINASFDWSVIVLAAFAVTITASTGHTIVGTAAVAASSRGIFRTRRTAANTWVSYRIAG